MIVCPNCQTENVDSASFCLHCGSSLASVKNPPNESPETKKCPFCAEEIKKDAIVCRYCGHDVRKENIEKSSKRKLNPYWGCSALVIIAVLIVFTITNPKKASHTNRILSSLGEIAGQQIAGSTGGLIGKLFGQTVGTISNWLDLSLFEYHNYIVFSTTTLGGRIITVGYLSNVSVIAPVEEWIDNLSSLINNIPANPFSDSSPINPLFDNPSIPNPFNKQPELQITFLGQDGYKVIGSGCPGVDYQGSIVDYHFIVAGVDTSKQVELIKVTVRDGSDTWTWPCDRFWALSATNNQKGNWDVYIAPSTPQRVYYIQFYYSDNTYDFGVTEIQ